MTGPTSASASPGGWTARSWETVTRSLGDFLGALPAEATALGIGFGMPFYGRTGSGAPLLFDVACGERLAIGCFAPDGVDPAALGWGTVAEHPGTASVWSDDDPVWRVDAGGPGEPKGRALAQLLVATARAAGGARAGRPGHRRRSRVRGRLPRQVLRAGPADRLIPLPGRPARRGPSRPTGRSTCGRPTGAGRTSPPGTRRRRPPPGRAHSRRAWPPGGSAAATTSS